ncbi:hypothetical protein HGRIS_001961 [Hohenbuehelia grisea]|uniref:Serine aminopeptidase S33 domain-containing protein n=1 Tax=Hohenbuehelia grisea TaxID=104357 RepID=A0ABR3JJM9_9AGAR
MAEFIESWLTGAQQTQFYTRTYPAAGPSPKAVVVFVHGFAEHIGRYTHIHPRLAQAGFSVFAFDQRGFGKTGLDAEKRSKDSAYGKTSRPEQIEDIDWAVKHAEEKYPGVPIFLMGHSMGGALVLSFATCSRPSVKLLKGIIATSPLILQTKPASKILRKVGGFASYVSPNSLIPAEVKAEDLSHDPAFNKAYETDPLVKPSGSLRGISDMLNGGERLLHEDYKNWPENIPVLFVHGTEDKVTSHKATEEFYNKINSSDKQLKLEQGGFHELQNEPNGVKENVYDLIISFVDMHIPPSPKL